MTSSTSSYRNRKSLGVVQPSSREGEYGRLNGSRMGQLDNSEYGRLNGFRMGQLNNNRRISSQFMGVTMRRQSYYIMEAIYIDGE